MARRTPIELAETPPIGHEPSGFHHFPEPGNRRQSALKRQLRDPGAQSGNLRVIPHHQSSDPRTATNILSRSCGLRSFSICSSMPRLRAAAWDFCTYWGAVGLNSRTRIAIFVSLGSNSLVICNRFAMTSPLILVIPVMLPPGLARPATSPVTTGSKVATNTTGISTRGGVPGRQDRRRAGSEEYVDLAADEFGCNCRNLRGVLRQTEIEGDVQVLDEFMLTQSSP